MTKNRSEAILLEGKSLEELQCKINETLKQFHHNYTLLPSSVTITQIDNNKQFELIYTTTLTINGVRKYNVDDKEVDYTRLLDYHYRKGLKEEQLQAAHHKLLTSISFTNDELIALNDLIFMDRLNITTRGISSFNRVKKKLAEHIKETTSNE